MISPERRKTDHIDRIEYSYLVLLVDDQAMVAQAVRRLLADQPDIDMHYCPDPAEAIRLANEIKPTVILQDLVMPGIGGLELVKLFRANGSTADTPIIVLSTREDPEVKSEAFAAGANDYLIKLPDKVELTARIRYHSRACLNRVQRDEAFRALRESQQKLLESNTSLIGLNQKLEEAMRVKSEFLAMMSHEIRTPMNAIVGMTDLALETELSREQNEYLTIVKGSAESLLTVINDILDFSRIESGKFAMDHIDFSLRETVENTIRTMAVQAHTKGLEIACRISADTPEELVGDPDRLRQVIVNLVGNALKFTSQGEVVVEIETLSRTEESAELHFAVRDTGIGIPADKLQIIFEAFVQADSSITRQYGGTGLGLAISTRIVALTGGRLWVESEVGKGSTFHFTSRFGLQKHPTAITPPNEFRGLTGLTVLIVDDNETSRRILEEMLMKSGMVPKSTASGLEALEELISAKEAGRPYPVILVDVLMPEMNGFELSQRIKEHPDLGRTEIIMLTSAILPADIARCRIGQVAAYLVKPIRRGELLDTILNVLTNSSGRPTQLRLPQHRSINERRRGIRILLAEDNPINQTVAMRILEKHGHRVTPAANGKEALLILEKAQFEGFDLILMDMQMPEMDGIEATRAIREMEQGTERHIPIIAMTAHAMKGDQERFLAAGMDGYISKPVRAKVLLDAIEQLIGIPTTASQPPTTSSTSHAETDRNVLLEFFDGDQEFLAEVVTIFLRDCPRQLTEIQEAIADGDAPRLEYAAHSLKGSVAHFAVPAVFYALQSLEKMGHMQDLAPAADAFASLLEKLPAVQKALAHFQNESSLS